MTSARATLCGPLAERDRCVWGRAQISLQINSVPGRAERGPSREIAMGVSFTWRDQRSQASGRSGLGEADDAAGWAREQGPLD